MVESGLGGALVRLKNITKEDYSTAFLFNLGISLFLFFLILLISGTIANYYNNSNLQKYLIVSSLILVFNSFQITYTAKLVRDFRFKTQSLYNIVSMTMGAMVGMLLALNGFGIWSILSVHLTFSLTLTLLYFAFEKSTISFVFNKNSFFSLYKFGLNTTIANIISTSFENIYQLIMGKYFSMIQTGLYYQAKKLEQTPLGVIKSSTLGVVYSYLAKMQDNKDEFLSNYKRIISLFSIFVGVISAFIYLFSSDLIQFLYGKEWLRATVYMQLLVIASFFYMHEMFNRIIFKVFDRTSQILYLELIKKVVQLITIFLGVILHSINVLLIGLIATNIISCFLNYHFSNRIIPSKGYWEHVLLFKVTLTIVISTLISLLIKNYFEISGFYSIGVFSFWLLIYFSTLKLLKVSDILQESRFIYLLFQSASKK